MTLFLGLLIVAGLIFANFLRKKVQNYEGIKNLVGETIACVLCICFVFCVIYFSVGALCLASSSTIIEKERGCYQIYSMKNSQSVSGSFFLGSGSIRGTDNYFYFAKDEHGGMHKFSAEAWCSSIFEQDKEQTPCIREIDIKRKAPDWIGFLFNGATMHERMRYEFYVPKGTIVETFKVD